MSRGVAISSRLARSVARRWPPLLAVAALLGLVEVAGRAKIGHGLVIVPATQMFAAALGLMGGSELWSDAVLPTVSAAGLACLISLPLGAAIGYAVWRWPLGRDAVGPYLTVLPALPLVALYPLLVVLFGTGRLPLVVVAVVGAFVPVATQTTAGLDDLRAVHLRLAQALRMTWARRLRTLYLPSLGRPLLTAARLAAAYSLIVVIGSELILSTRGLGRMIRLAYDGFDLDTMYGAILIVIGLVCALYGGIGLLQRWMLRWEGARS